MGHFIEEDVQEYIQPIAPKIQWVNWNFFGMDAGEDNNFKQNTAGLNTIFLGNSASPFNNHLDALEHLSDLTTDLKIVAPLSYSGSDEYIQKVCVAGSKKFGKQFVPLLDFLPMDEYYSLMENVKAAVFFNLRSQAAGNILWFLTNNIPVFMLEENNLYKMLTDSGIVVYSVQKDLDGFLKDGEGFINKNDNSIMINEMFGEQAMSLKYQSLLN